MKRYLALLLTFVLVFTAMLLCFSTAAIAAVEEHELYSPSVSSSENTFVKAALSERNLYGTGFDTEILFGSNNEARFILAHTDNGFLIFDRMTQEVWECGEVNPYSGQEGAKKYYAGPLSYYVAGQNIKSDGIAQASYYNIITQNYVNQVPPVGYFINRARKELPAKAESVSVIKRIKNHYTYVKRASFGYNDDGTCTAVAFGLALNYFNRQYGYKYVPKTCEILNEGFATASNIKNKYRNTYLVHLGLKVWGMGHASIGSSVPTALNAYFIRLHVPTSQRPTVTAAWWPRFSTIKSHIDANKPVVITTTFFGDIQWHSMLAYGYRETSSSHELLVHLGWYDDTYLKYVSSSNAKQLYHVDHWINANLARYAYYFDLPNA